MKVWFINLNPGYQALLATTFTWFVTALGASLVFCFKKINKNVMDSMLGFSAGVMIAASFWSLLSPAITLATDLKINACYFVFIGFIIGGIFLFLSDKIYTYINNKRRKRNDKECDKSLKRMIMLVFSITIHNIPEGFCIGVAFGSLAYNLPGVSLLSASLLALGIGIQNFPEGFAVSAPLRREGYSLKKSFFYGQISAIVEPIAGVIGAILVLKIRTLLPFFLSFAAGAMIYVVTSELIPESQTNKNKGLITIFTLIGFSIMMILDVILG